jgi:diguanylate cyclase (GGDEF)-like protein
MLISIPGLREELERCWSERTKSRTEVSVPLPDGKTLYLALTIAFVPPEGVMVHSEDITATRQAHLELERRALHDALTGLPNRILLYSRLSEAVGRARRAGSSTALLVLDRNRFKDMNDTLGHGAGDTLLHTVSTRLTRLVRAEHAGRAAGLDLVARLGGDEFAVLLDVADRAGALGVAQTILDGLLTPVELDGHLIAAEASIGIAVFPDDADTPDELLRRADVAMYAAKNARLGEPVSRWPAACMG